MQLLNDEYYMRLAIQLAAGATGQTGINPVVGCVLVKEGRIIGMGAHLKRGTPHAEIHALQMAGAEAEGSTAYVTLEPCSHYGQTPPCSDRLIQEKVKRVVVGCSDPNPLVAGTGIAKLRNHGIQVDVGLLETEARQLNEVFNKFIITRRPFVTLKTASTLDGKIASRTGDSKWITNAESRSYVHTLRHRHQSIMVGIGTVLSDDPLLTTRLEVPGLHPIRVIVDSGLRLPLDAKVVVDRSIETIVLTTEEAAATKRDELEAAGVTVLACGAGPKVDLAKAMELLGEREISSILLEGGGQLNGSMLELGLIDKLLMFFAPKIVGGGNQAPDNFQFSGFESMKDAIQLERTQVQQFGEDICIAGYPLYRNEV
ncbi:bifunctional diaminohydroxyphosphoribosylaminopyrimidine deaminase/5-amino-6-(5-phosphoribosylamino)uracil reductase RibD [Paenibacillus radicis (ex Xue et al. 2023)]|uniref:Riboflavin biosynthesis protein RibD n=1 Tax=Paenibacillus radicis (ex Xue et al. 2023) TaxID=2972489 RepID=A0ABT1YN03_9BACL|nr:bifunctional diaminohydroxyphosphoribosylaminopyrimidine deaminase/5-amino-6-(5-phosphoribosylamino)uracil reductase RibD [Paenibacillus radicis (ex Xue et al. 2023)]MCR8634407.1 bifunctional diaminohydroxyphosphoribosylaminopyrimidine deaminase/5-amino-6-(5-phosphoribosylamino)uracil reductase RibD [Paenibacillus radicis (ex Xue et al. 2023)]